MPGPRRLSAITATPVPASAAASGRPICTGTPSTANRSPDTSAACTRSARPAPARVAARGNVGGRSREGGACLLERVEPVQRQQRPHGAAAVGEIDRDELVRVRERDRPERHRVQDREAGRDRADAERQRHHDDGREAGVGGQLARREPEIAQEGGHVGAAEQPAYRALLPGRNAAVPAGGAAARGNRRPASGHRRGVRRSGPRAAPGRGPRPGAAARR